MISPVRGSRRIKTSEDRNRYSAGIVTCWLLPLINTRAFAACAIASPSAVYHAIQQTQSQAGKGETPRSGMPLPQLQTPGINE
jgi:hypothetical protein